MENFKCLRVYENKDADNKSSFEAKIQSLTLQDLPQNDTIIRVEYSSLNYKDALSATGNKGVTRHYPHTPGIDGSGTVLSSQSELFKEGDKVLVTGYDLGMNTHGGFSEYISVPSSWIIKISTGLTTKEVMLHGTAGFTAALSVYEISQNISPEQGSILITGASGGVGSSSIKLLSKLGYHVTALSSKANSKDYLKKIGASEVLLREDFLEKSDRLLLSESFAGLIDTVGSQVLDVALKSLKYGGFACACGNAAGFDLKTNVFPFILRGITLKGIDSVQCPKSTREKIWKLLSEDWKTENLSEGIEEISLSEILPEIDKILAGKKTGRSVVKL